MNRDALLQRVWYDSRPLWLLIVLIPLSWLFAAVSALRRLGYRCGFLASVRVACPVIVVGNISVGGTGKTPLVMWLAVYLQQRGMRVGIITRGYGGSAVDWPREVSSASSTDEVGDEPVMMASRTDAIVVAGPDRVAAAQRALQLGAQIILSDDGMQHYRLRRDAEIAVIDGVRGLGNRRLLPAGPLRESPQRLDTVSLLVATQRLAGVASVAMENRHLTARMQLVEAVAMVGGEMRRLATFGGQQVHALAAIGNPQAFFDGLRSTGLHVIAHAFPDHARLSAADITFADELPVFMTEKDAVKCRHLADHRHWFIRVDLQLSDADAASMATMIDESVQRFRGANRPSD